MVYDELREEYEGPHLDEAEASPDPFVQFRRWFDDAVAAKLHLANAMSLATVGPDGQPSSRVVLLKKADHEGFVFYSNYKSRKGRDLEANPRASLLFWWQSLYRQVRIEGRVAMISAEKSNAYFASRPRESNISALASAQSEVVESRAALEAVVERVRSEWQGRELSRPAWWGGYRLVPTSFEFWQGRGDRAHDRLRYSLDADGTWAIRRLFP